MCRRPAIMKIKKQLLASAFVFIIILLVPILNLGAKIGKMYIPSPEKIPFQGRFFSTIVVDRKIMF